MKNTDTRSTLALIDATLRLTEKPLWEDHDSFCECEGSGLMSWRAPMRMDAHDYPATVTHGPLILGPEPGPVRLPDGVVPA